MAKATTEGGASNAAEVWTCAACGCLYTAGAPRCPECPSTEHEAEEPGAVTETDGQAPPEPEAVPVTEAPAPSPDAVPSRTPPRRAAPPGD